MKVLRRTFLFLLLGMALGAGAGVLVGWYVWPTEFSDATVEILDVRYQQEYALMAAQAYRVDGNLLAAQQRLVRINRSDPAAWYLAFTVDRILAGGAAADLRDLVRLATDLGLQSPAFAPYLPEEPAGGQ